MHTCTLLRNQTEWVSNPRRRKSALLPDATAVPVKYIPITLLAAFPLEIQAPQA